MRKFMYPIGAEVCGRVLEAREELNALPVTIGDAQYPAATIEALDVQSLAELGIKEIFEEPAPEGMLSGPPEDREEATAIYRTWPHPRPPRGEEGNIEEQ
jgi:hypothetical protein